MRHSKSSIGVLVGALVLGCVAWKVLMIVPIALLVTWVITRFVD